MVIFTNYSRVIFTNHLFYLLLYLQHKSRLSINTILINKLSLFQGARNRKDKICQNTITPGCYCCDCHHCIPISRPGPTIPKEAVHQSFLCAWLAQGMKSAGASDWPSLAHVTALAFRRWGRKNKLEIYTHIGEIPTKEGDGFWGDQCGCPGNTYYLETVINCSNAYFFVN